MINNLPTGEYLINTLYPTIQGEGTMVGTPMFLLRLQGCPVGCPFCDTKETWEIDPQNQISDWEELSAGTPHYIRTPRHGVGDLIRKAAEYYRLPNISWVLVTGGEPLLYDLDPLIRSCREKGFKIAVETSGTMPVTGFPDWLTVSPKDGMPGGLELNQEALIRANEIKMVIGKATDFSRLEGILGSRGYRPAPVVLLQPISQGKRATQLCVEYALKRGYRVSLQLHKYLGVD